MIFGMVAKKAGDVGAQRDDAQVIRARKIERGARELGRYAVAFERSGDFRVLEHDAIGEQAIGEERTKAVHSGFEAMGCFVVGDCDSVEV